MSARSPIAVALLSLLFPALAGQRAQEHPALYSIQDLGPVSIERSGAAPSIDGRGAVAITSPDGAVLWQDGVARKLDGLAGACDLDESGAVVGWVTESGRGQASLWMNDEIVRVGPPDALESVALVVDRGGRIAGTYLAADGTERSFLDDHGAVTDVPGLGGSEIAVKAMNDLGLVAGSAEDAHGRTHAFQRTGDRSTDLDPFRASKSSASVAEAVNGDGVVVGSASLGGASFGVVFEHGRAAALPRLPGTVTRPRAVDGRGRIVGNASAGDEQRAILIAGQQIVDLETVLGPEIAEWHLLDATGIDEAGEIVGVGEHAGKLVAFVLRPLSGAGIVAPPPRVARAPSARTATRTATPVLQARAARTPRPQPRALSSADPVTGTWHVRGRDLTDWTATLELDGTTHEGTFDWLSTEGYSGRELVTWSYDQATRAIHLAGHAMLHPVGDICTGTYVATLADDERQLVGTWGPPMCAPGTWTAQR